MSRIIICANRGMQDKFPENTLTSIKAAFNSGMAVAVDLRFTVDKQLIVISDRTVGRTTNGVGSVNNLSLEDVQKLDAGHWFDKKFLGLRVPRFQQVLALAAKYSKATPALIINLKVIEPGAVKLICNTLNQYNLMTRTIGIGLIAVSVDIRRRFIESDSDFSCAAKANTPEEFQNALQDPFASAIYSEYLPTLENLESVNAAGKTIILNTKESIYFDESKTYVNSGVQVVLTDNPSDFIDSCKGV